MKKICYVLSSLTLSFLIGCGDPIPDPTPRKPEINLSLPLHNNATHKDLKESSLKLKKTLEQTSLGWANITDLESQYHNGSELIFDIQKLLLDPIKETGELTHIDSRDFKRVDLAMSKLLQVKIPNFLQDISAIESDDDVLKLLEFFTSDKTNRYSDENAPKNKLEKINDPHALFAFKNTQTVSGEKINEQHLKFAMDNKKQISVLMIAFKNEQNGGMAEFILTIDSSKIDLSAYISENGKPSQFSIKLAFGNTPSLEFVAKEEEQNLSINWVKISDKKILFKTAGKTSEGEILGNYMLSPSWNGNEIFIEKIED